MGLYPQDRSEIPEDTAQIGRKLLGEQNPYRVVGDQLSDWVVDAEFQDLYTSTGGPAISPVVLSLVLVFQMLEHLPDRQAAEAVRVRIDWKYALHLPLADEGFAYTNLSHFRARLLAGGAEYRVFDRLVERLERLGFLRRRGPQRTDSTHILGAVAKLSRLELVWETFRVALAALQRHEAGWVQQQVPAALRDLYLPRRSDYQLSERAVEQELRQTGADGAWFLQQVHQQRPQVFQHLPEVATMRQVWEQQFTVDDAGQGGQPRTKLDGGGLIQSPHDPEARYSEKRGKGWQGYKGQLTETAEAAGQANFITDVDVTDAQQADVRALPAIQARLQQRDLLPSEQFVDQSYVSTTQLATSQRAGIRLVGPLPQTMSNGLFPVSAFQFDLDHKRATCPGGRTAQYGALSQRANGTQEYVFSFGKQCLTCPLQSHCTQAKQGRTVRYSVDHPFLEQRLAEMQTAEFWQAMKRRPPIEGTLAQLTRLGARWARYRGLAKTRLQWVFSAVAVNLRRLANALTRSLAPRPAIA